MLLILLLMFQHLSLLPHHLFHQSIRKKEIPAVYSDVFENLAFGLKLTTVAIYIGADKERYRK